MKQIADTPCQSLLFPFFQYLPIIKFSQYLSAFAMRADRIASPLPGPLKQISEPSLGHGSKPLAKREQILWLHYTKTIQPVEKVRISGEIKHEYVKLRKEKKHIEIMLDLAYTP